MKKNKNKIIPTLLASALTLPLINDLSANFNSYISEDNNGNKTEIVTDTDYQTMAKVKEDLNKFCFQIETDSPNLKSLQNYLKDMKETSNFTRTLYEEVKKSKSYFCEVGEITYSPETVAMYDFGKNTMFLQNIDDTDDAYLTHYLIHEMVHAIQDHNKSAKTGVNWDLESRIKSTFAIEAAANTAVMIAGFEGKQEGKSELWDSLQEIVDQDLQLGAFTRNLLDSFENNYNENIEQGKTHIESINIAGENSWIEIISNSTDWKKSYTIPQIERYNGLVDYYLLRADKIDSNFPSNEQVSKVGEISEYNFSQNLNASSFINNDKDAVKDLPSNYKDAIKESEAYRLKKGTRLQ